MLNISIFIGCSYSQMAYSMSQKQQYDGRYPNFNLAYFRM